MEGHGVEAAADWEHLRTPETYLGRARGERLANDPPERLLISHWSVRGQWEIGAESVILGRPAGSIAFRFHARDAHLVLASRTGDPIPFHVRLDGEAPKSSHGVDIDAGGDGVLREGRLYQLVRTDGDVRERTPEIAFADRGAEAFVFTFG